MERELIMEALRRASDNRKLAAEMLGISERTLYYRLTRYRLR
jgi:transcriptional regulator with PAS, ATPase and Fis domain